MPRLAARAPRRARARPTAADRPGRAHRRSPRLTRNEARLARPRLAVVAWRPSAVARRRRLRLVAVAGASSPSLVFAPWMVRDWLGVRQPAARPGAAERARRSPASTSSPGTTRRRSSRYLAVGPARLARDARRRARPQPVHASCSLPGLPISIVGLARACRGRPAAARPRPLADPSRDDVPRHEPGLPGRRRPGARSSTPPGPVHVLLIIVSALLGARCRDRPPGRPARLDAARRLARRRRSAVFGSLLFSVALLPAFGGRLARRTRPVLRELGARAWRPIGHPLDAPRARSSRTSRSGWPRPRASRALALPDEPPSDVARPRDRHFPARRLLVVMDDDAHGGWPGSSTRPARTPTASTSSTWARPVTLACDDAWPDVRGFEVVCP